jgi:hypothetical protein
MAIKLNISELNILTEVNGGRGPQPNPEENKQLAIDYAGMPENGLTMSDLVGKYGSSPKNLYDRLERMGVPRHKKPSTKPKKFRASKPFFHGVESEKKS